MISGRFTIGLKPLHSDVMVKSTLLAMFVIGLCGCNQSSSNGNYDDTKAASPAFVDEFGFAPPSKITNIKAKVIQQGDTFARWLKFTYDKALIDRILSKDWEIADQNKLESGSVWSQAVTTDSPNQPAWWPNEASRMALPIFYVDKPHESGAQHYSIIIIDAVSGEIYCKSCIWQ